jgi:hypothetical protein
MPLGTARTEQGSGADALQRPLRFRFRRRLTASVKPPLLVCRHRYLSLTPFCDMVSTAFLSG